MLEVISKIADTDPGSADLVAAIVAYEALCEELDRVRPALERDGARLIAKRLEGARELLAKRYVVAGPSERAELQRTADQLEELATGISKADSGVLHEDKPDTPWWDKKGQDGRFLPREGNRAQTVGGTMDGLKLFAGPVDRDIKREGRRTFDAVASGDKYQRARVLGRLLGRSQDPNAQTASGIMQLAGNLGPEAEEVFGNSVRRTAYRYRGTERRPSEYLQRTAVAAAATAGLDPTTGRQLQSVDEQRRLDETAKVGARHLWPQVPDAELARLSLASGKLPPSRGVIFGADGRVVSEAMGYNGDHYLPFDLKNLKRLQGGSYVRTRTTGGLTDEDIYTGVMTGARRIDVISNSGVFSLEFDPSLRGGRRYSDKARQMVDRYAKIIGTVASESLTRGQLDPKVNAELRRKAFQRARGDEALANEYYTKAKQAAVFEAKFNAVDDDELMEQAKELALNEPVQPGRNGSTRALAQAQQEHFRRLKAEQNESQIRAYRLDGQGYNAAMKALKQEFPYFIRDTSFVPLNRWLPANTKMDPNEPLPRPAGPDIGYSPRGGLQQGVSGKKGSDAKAGAEEKKTTSSSLGDGSGSQVAENSADDLRTLLAQPGSPARKLAAGAFNPLYGYNAALPADRRLQPPAIDIKGPDDAAAFLSSGGDWLGWAMANKEGRDASSLAAFLTDPNTDIKHLDLAEDGFSELAATADPTNKPRMENALQWVRSIKQARQPFAELGRDDDPVYNDVSIDKDKNPAPFEDIVPLVSKGRRGLLEYAEKKPEVAELAQGYLRDEQAALLAVSEEASKLGALAKWPDVDGNISGDPDPDSPPTPEAAKDADLLDLAAALQRNPQDVDEYLELEKKQKALALARVAGLWSRFSGQPIDLTKDRAVTSGKALAPPRAGLPVHGPGSPISKALAGMHRRSAAVPRQPASR